MTPSEPQRQPRPRRKSKPSFEIPPEVASPPAGGWAYRTEPAPRAAADSRPVTPPPNRSTSGALTGGMEIVALGFTMMGRMSLVALTLFSAPLGVARRLLPSALVGPRDGKRD